MREIGDIKAQDAVCAKVVCEMLVSDTLTLCAPRKYAFFHDQAAIFRGTYMSPEGVWNQRLGICKFQWPAALNDTFYHYHTVIPAGVYDFSVLGRTGTGHGVVDWYLNKTRIAAAQDWYADPGGYNEVKIVPNIEIAAGVYRLLGRMVGKNALSTGYKMSLTKYWFTKTG